ncbi:uncharacterized protein LOC132208268 [Stegostoma tigrinum]|uniref:uncharacterized protein LOC132208268 n=1 Tax=Stegostoma tigrinum TaxID=3053191 RepID=UPI00286FFA2A|nr:uncharacterized protein LOC132208268 [Stegostoma tigrinum]
MRASGKYEKDWGFTQEPRIIGLQSLVGVCGLLPLKAHSLAFKGFQPRVAPKLEGVAGSEGGYPRSTTRPRSDGAKEGQMDLDPTTSNPVLRQPLSASVPAGGTATSTCWVTNVNIADDGGFWYQLRPGQKPRWVLVHWTSGQGNRGTGYTDRYLPSRDSATSSYMLTISSISEADTGTYYCATVKDNMVFLGNGIHLLIPAPQGTRGSYSWSSYLTIPTKDWQAHSRFSCQLEHESSEEPLVAVVDRESCPLS